MLWARVSLLMNKTRAPTATWTLRGFAPDDVMVTCVVVTGGTSDGLGADGPDDLLHEALRHAVSARVAMPERRIA